MHTCMTKQAESEEPEEEMEAGSQMDLYFVVVMLLLVIAFVIWQWTKFKSGVDHQKPPIETLGQVKAVTFVNGWSLYTQVDTERRPVLIKGAVGLVKGELLEIRQTTFEYKVCIQASSKCWEMRSQ